MAKVTGSAASSAKSTPTKQAQPAPRGEWPILEPLPEEDENAVVNTAAGLDEGPTGMASRSGDDLTPDALLGDHRDGHWAEREDEHDDRSIN